MATKTIRAAPNGAKLIEATLAEGSPARVVDTQYTVMGPASPEPAYQGPDRAAADKAFDAASKQSRPG
jgi:hypothetical protein